MRVLISLLRPTQQKVNLWIASYLTLLYFDIFILGRASIIALPLYAALAYLFSCTIASRHDLAALSLANFNLINLKLALKSLMGKVKYLSPLKGRYARSTL